MRKVKIESRAFISSPNEKKFVVLGSEDASTPEYISKNILPKINKKTTATVPGFWGTLGVSNDDKINWSGHLEISSHGNDSFTGVVEDEVKLIKSCFPNLKQEPSSIIERFISFEHVDFTFPEAFTLDTIPSLRLDLMLKHNESAVVFYQSDKEDVDDNLIEYILPNATNKGNTNERDRLTYIFDIIPQKQIEEIKGASGLYQLSTTKSTRPFIIKIITFKRSDNTKSFSETLERVESKEIILKVKDELSKQNVLNKVAKDHRLLVFNSDSNNFSKATIDNIHTDKKTLFLIHGTFGSTEASFGELYGDKGVWLKSLVDKDKLGVYEQILAFDHPTVFMGAEENIAILLMQLDELNIKPFAKEVDFIGTSQGGLLVQYMANLKNDKIKVGKAALIASANGVGYFTFGKYVAKFLTILKYIFKHTGMQAESLISALAQHSVEFILKQPGFEVMTPGNEKLDSIMNTKPYSKKTLYLPIIDHYDESLFDDESKKIKRFFKKLGGGIVDNIVGLILGEDNDWVVGTRNQFIVPASNCAIPAYNPAKYRDEMIPAIHGTCIYKPDAQKKLEGFFVMSSEKALVKSVNHDYFDAHCHIFGREVISGRIILLLLQELLSYKKAKSSTGKLLEVPDLEKYLSNDTKGETGSVAKNIIKYFALNKNSYQMLNDLEDEYYKLDSNVYRYIPLMFDLEMTFRNSYLEHDVEQRIKETESDFKKQVKEFIKDLDKLIKQFEKHGKPIVDSTHVDNEESVKVLKIIKMALEAFKVADIDLKNDTLTGYFKQLNELKGLKVRYDNNIFPFLAVDPRRENMAKIIEENVGIGKTFHGIKIYTPNGYSPTDPHLFDDTKGFVNGTSLYTYCIENKIPIMAHCSNAGFSTFAMELEVYGDILLKGEKVTHYDKPTKITFDSSITQGGFAKAVRERAYRLNHPILWRKVLEKHPDLKICLAHFGGESPDWRKDIAQLMRDFPNVYTDLSCMVDKSRLEDIKEEYFDTKDPILNKVMYGSDFFLSMLNKIKFKNYYKHFIQSGMFSKEQMKMMSVETPEKFLGL